MKLEFKLILPAIVFINFTMNCGSDIFNISKENREVLGNITEGFVELGQKYVEKKRKELLAKKKELTLKLAEKKEEIEQHIEAITNEFSYIKSWKLIRFAIDNSNIEELKEILNPNTPDFEKKLNSPIFLPPINQITASSFIYRSTPVIYSAQKNFASGVEYLVINGADINAQIKLFLKNISTTIDDSIIFGFTALHFAVQHGNLSLVKFLVENGADVNKSSYFDMDMNKKHLTPLHIACSNINNPHSYEIIKYLIEHGAVVNARNFYKQTPYDLVEKKPKSENKNKIMNYLVSVGANKKSSFLMS